MQGLVKPEASPNLGLEVVLELKDLGPLVGTEATVERLRGNNRNILAFFFLLPFDLLLINIYCWLTLIKSWGV